MYNGVMKVWFEFLYLVGVNVIYVEDFYELYLSDFDLVSEEWKCVFDGLFVYLMNVVE